MTDAVWATIQEFLCRDYGIVATDEVREAIDSADTLVFDGGMFVFNGPHIDCFVEKGREGRWATRKLLNQAVGGTIEKHGLAKVRIHEENTPSLRFAKSLQFVEVGRAGGFVEMERRSWVML